MITKTILKKENNPEGYRTTTVDHECDRCGASWIAVYRGVWDGKELKAEKEVSHEGVECVCVEVSNVKS